MGRFKKKFIHSIRLILFGFATIAPSSPKTPSTPPAKSSVSQSLQTLADAQQEVRHILGSGIDSALSPCSTPGSVDSDQAEHRRWIEYAANRREQQKNKWARFFRNEGDELPGYRDTLDKALDAAPSSYPDHPLVAIDLGCGQGRDTIGLIENNWKVIAIDSEEIALEKVKQHARERDLPEKLLETRRADFETIDLGKPASANLINAGLSLQFCHKDAFPKFWAKIVKTLKPGGFFSGQLLGDKDVWNDGDVTMNFHTRAEVEALFSPFEIVQIKEDESSLPLASGGQKIWHIFHIVAKKK